jgi:hypothetical protein
MPKSFNFSDYTGKGIKVALIDSGINPTHSHVEWVNGGINFTFNEAGEVIQGVDYQDHVGHGTALAGIFRKKASSVSLYAIKIFDRVLKTQISVLEKAIEWAIRSDMKIVNLSLGTSNPDHEARLKVLCDEAEKERILIVASGIPGQKNNYPAVFSNVIGVAGDEYCQWDEYFYVEGDPVPFRAHPQPRPIPGIPQERNLKGHSFASAHIGALVTCMVEKYPTASYKEIKDILRENSAYPYP